MDAVYNYILEYYKAGEPIFLSDIKMSEVSDETIRQQLKRLADAGKLMRYEAGITEHLGEGRRKTLKYKILRPISEELGLPISNWEKIESDKDYNCYIFAYDPLDGYVEESLYPGVKLETALGSYSFPTELRVVTSYVYEFLKEEDVELVEEFALQPFTMRLQSVVRTFVDKVFALCDYYMEGKSERYSRHLYDLYKLRPVITFDENFATLVKEVRAHRAAMKQTCPSSKPGIDVPEVIRAFCKNGFFSEDYSKITSYFINARGNCATPMKNTLGSGTNVVNLVGEG